VIGATSLGAYGQLGVDMSGQTDAACIEMLTRAMVVVRDLFFHLPRVIVNPRTGKMAGETGE
jgi:hypothetical protein